MKKHEHTHHKRLWWHKPDFRDPDVERRVSWLELFYDLVFVALIAQLTHHLVMHPDLKGLLVFVFLFLPVWYAWLTGAYYFDAFETHDLSIRVFTYIQMIAVAGMAVFIGGAMNETSIPFAIAYIMHHGFSTLMFLRAGRHNMNIPHMKSVVQIPVIGFGLSTTLFIISIFVPLQIRLVLWGVALFVDLLTPIVFAHIISKRETSFGSTSAKMRERFGLMSIIVLGELVIGVITVMTDQEILSTQHIVLGMLGVSIAFAVWWIYFDTVARRTVKTSLWWRQLWTYMHLFVFAGIAAAGAGLIIILEHVGTEETLHGLWLLPGSLGVSLIAIGLMAPSFTDETQKLMLAPKSFSFLKMLKILIGAGLLVLAFFTHALGIMTLLIVILGSLLLIIGYLFYLWIESTAEQEHQAQIAEEGSR